MGTPVTRLFSRKRHRDDHSLGQGLTEFALLLPMILLLMLIALDFGRVFLGWVGLNNAARVAANYAAMHPGANDWQPDPNPIRDEYLRLVAAETEKLSCSPTTVDDPTYPAGTQIGFPARVEITCQFGIITPIISSIVGAGVPVTASASFPIRFGAIGGIPVDPGIPGPTPTPTPTPSPTPTPGPTPTPTPTPTPGPTPTPTPSPTPTPTPIPMCVVPNLIGVNTKDAPKRWGRPQGAGFATPLLFVPAVGGNNHYTIRTQNRTVGASLPCNTTIMTVTP
jgi:hypothetical protein